MRNRWIKKRVATVLIALVALKSSHPDAMPAPQPGGPVRVSTEWRVSLDAGGAVIDVVPRVADAPLRDRLIAAIRSWRFTVPRVNGRPVPATTCLRVDITRIRRDADENALRIDAIETGGCATYRVPPRYPTEASRHRLKGLVVLEVDYDEHGRVTSADPAQGAPDAPAPLVAATRAAMLRWRFDPETIDGRPVAGASIVPRCFNLTRPGQAPRFDDCAWTPPGASAPTNAAFSVRPKVRIVTDVVGRAI